MYGQGFVIWSDLEVTKNDQIKSVGMGGNQSKFWNSPTPGCGQKAGSFPGKGMQEVPEQVHWDYKVYNRQVYAALGVIKDSCPPASDKIEGKDPFLL